MMTMRDIFVPIIIMCIIMFILGLLCGLDISKTKKKSSGTFHINTTDPDKDVIQIELDIPIVKLMNEKEVYFVVKIEENSQHLHPL